MCFVVIMEAADRRSTLIRCLLIRIVVAQISRSNRPFFCHTTYWKTCERLSSSRAWWGVGLRGVSHASDLVLGSTDRGDRYVRPASPIDSDRSWERGGPLPCLTPSKAFLGRFQCNCCHDTRRNPMNTVRLCLHSGTFFVASRRRHSKCCFRQQPTVNVHELFCAVCNFGRGGVC